MKDVACSTTGCPGFVVFQHILYTPKRPHVTSYCHKHKEDHDKQVKASKDLQNMPTQTNPTRQPEDIMADSAIFLMERLRELKTPEALRALERVKRVIQ